MKEKICKNCRFWQPNGGVLNRGYCVANKWVYRAAWQTCEKFEEGTVFRIDYDLMDYEGTISTRCVRVKAATETEARVWFDQRVPGAVFVRIVREDEADLAEERNND